MHSQTNKILKLSSIFKSIDSEKYNGTPAKSIQSEVKSDHEIKQIITELQKEDASPSKKQSIKNLDMQLMSSIQNVRLNHLYQQSFQKKDKMAQLEKKVQKDRGITFKPNINGKYKPPLRVKRNSQLPLPKTKSKEFKDPLNIPFYPTIEYD